MLSPLIAAAFAEAPVAMAVLEPKAPFRLRTANARFMEDTKVAGGESGEGRSLGELLPAAIDTELELALEQVAQSRQPITLVLISNDGRERHWEVTLSYLNGPGALLYIGLDITAREEQRRSLEAAHARATTVTSAGDGPSFDIAEIVSSTATAVSTLCDGPTAIYIAEATGRLRRAATRGVTEDMLPALPEVLADGFRLVSEAITAGKTRSSPSLHALASNERLLMRLAHAAWLAVSPIPGRARALGVILTVWRRAGGPRVGDIPAIESVARQLALSLEHASVYAIVDNERARLDAVVEQMPDAVWIADAGGRLVQVNSAARRLLNLAPAAPLPALDVITARVTRRAPATAGPADLGFTEALAGRAVFGQLYSWARQETGERAWLQASAAPLHDRDGVLTGAIAVATDITERKHAEDALELLAETSRTLTESLASESALGRMAELLVRSLADCCVLDLIQEDLKPRRVAVGCGGSGGASGREADSPDPLAHREFRDALLGGRVQFRPELPDAVLAQLARDDAHLTALRTLGIRSYLAVPLVSRGRTLGVMQLMTLKSGRRYGPADLALAEDLARRAATAIDNAQLFQRAQEADRRKDEFLAVLSHELRTPLAPILSWAQILLRDPDPAYVRQAATAIERNVRLQTTLINDLLDLTSIERDKLLLDQRPFDLREAVQGALETVASQAQKKGVQLRRFFPPGAVPVEGDGNRLQQVFWNLLSNAIKFTPSGGSVTVEMHCTDGAVVRVRDTGSGIAPEFLPRVFDMFKQQEQGTRRSYGGLGIGLALAKRLVDLHGGTIQASSDGAGRGSEFTVLLPVIATAPTESAVAEATAAAPIRRLDGLRVLFVEDAADTSRAARLMLERLGARVSTAGDGVEALTRVARVVPDVILCDLRMPRMDGFELLHRLRDDPAHARIPVIAVSGLTSLESRQKVERAGFDGYVSKPFDAGVLSGVILDAVDLRPRARAS